MEHYLSLLHYEARFALKCAEIKGWKKDPILDAYNDCIKDRLKNEWWFKNKLFKSPNGEYFVGLYNTYDLDGYVVYIVVHDGDRKELERRVVFKDIAPSFI